MCDGHFTLNLHHANEALDQVFHDYFRLCVQAEFCSGRSEAGNIFRLACAAMRVGVGTFGFVGIREVA